MFWPFLFLSLNSAHADDAQQQQFLDIVQKYSGQLRKCHEAAIKDLGHLFEAQERWTLTLQAGRVVGLAGPEKVGDREQGLRDCLDRKLKRWRFPAAWAGSFGFQAAWTASVSNPVDRSRCRRCWDYAVQSEVSLSE